MSDSTDCPSDRLADFSLGLTDDEESATIGNHLDGCPACRAAAAVAAPDPLLERVRAAARHDDRAGLDLVRRPAPGPGSGAPARPRSGSATTASCGLSAVAAWA